MKLNLIKCGKFQLNLIQSILETQKRKPMNFNEMLKMALAGKNKQAHRIAGGTKEARKLQAQHSEKYTITKGQSDERIRGLEISKERKRDRDELNTQLDGYKYAAERANSKTDI